VKKTFVFFTTSSLLVVVTAVSINPCLWWSQRSVLTLACGGRSGQY